jgi:hypothetical protein
MFAHPTEGGDLLARASGSAVRAPATARHRTFWPLFDGDEGRAEAVDTGIVPELQVDWSMRRLRPNSVLRRGSMETQFDACRTVATALADRD